MKLPVLTSFIFCSSFSFGQTLYNPQDLYDSPGGLFDEDSLRTINLDFYNPNYHNYLVNSWFYSPSERIPAKLILNGVDAESCPSLAIISTVPKSYKFSINSSRRIFEVILN